MARKHEEGEPAVSRMQCKSVLLAGVGFLVLAVPCAAFAQNQSPFMTGATSLESNILAWMTPIAIILVIALGAMAMANRISWGWCIAAILGIAFKAQGRHLFIKPRVARLRTNITVLTNRRSYEFDYSVTSWKPDPDTEPVIYALRFTYRHSRVAAKSQVRERISRDLAHGPVATRNFDYGYCGSPSLKPEAVWDNGVQTWIRFGARHALPAVFVLGADGNESLVNFSVHRGDVVVQRVVRRLVLRRGKLKGCIVNEAFRASGVRLRSGTVSPNVERHTV